MPRIHKTADTRNLTPKQARAVAAILEGQSITDAAAYAGIHVRTLYDWLGLETFKAAIRDGQARIMEHAQSRLMAGQDTALSALESIIQDGTIPPGVRRAACVDWLSITLKFREATEIENRLAALEERIR